MIIPDGNASLRQMEGPKVSESGNTDKYEAQRRACGRYEEASESELRIILEILVEQAKATSIRPTASSCHRWLSVFDSRISLPFLGQDYQCSS